MQSELAGRIAQDATVGSQAAVAQEPLRGLVHEAQAQIRVRTVELEVEPTCPRIEGRRGEGGEYDAREEQRAAPRRGGARVAQHPRTQLAQPLDQHEARRKAEQDPVDDGRASHAAEHVAQEDGGGR